jgi:hypothetical protein
MYMCIHVKRIPPPPPPPPRAVSRPGRAGAGGSDRGADNRSYRAVYRALAAVYRRRRRGRGLAAVEGAGEPAD